MAHADQLYEAWSEASDDLGITVEKLNDSVVVRRFGSSRGMLVAIRQSLPEQRELQRDAEQRGMGWSALDQSSLVYERDLFIDTLNDWGWCSDAEPPPCYTGERWSG